MPVTGGQVQVPFVLGKRVFDAKGVLGIKLPTVSKLQEGPRGLGVLLENCVEGEGLALSEGNPAPNPRNEREKVPPHTPSANEKTVSRFLSPVKRFRGKTLHEHLKGVLPACFFGHVPEHSPVMEPATDVMLPVQHQKTMVLTPPLECCWNWGLGESLG
jgi:hypothetical protein